MNKIKKFYVHNKFLSLLGILSLIVSVTYIISIDWPEWYRGAGALFEFVYNLCLAYLGSLIFYIIQVYIPELKRNNEVRRKIFKQLFSIDCEIVQFESNLQTLKVCIESNYNYEDFMKLSSKCLLKKDPPNNTEEFNSLYLNNFSMSLRYLENSMSNIEDSMNMIYFTELNGNIDPQIIDNRIYEWIRFYKIFKINRRILLDGQASLKFKFYQCMYTELIKLYDIYSKEQILKCIKLN